MRDAQIPRSQTRLRHWANRTHRFVALSAVVFLIVITATGLVLNHADALGMSTRGAGFLADVYGIDAPPVDAAFEARENVFATAAGTLYANGEALSPVSGPIRGAAPDSNGDIVVATAAELILTTGEADPIERANVDPGAPILRAGKLGGNLVVATAERHFIVDSATLSLAEDSQVDPADVAWAEPVSLAADQQRRIATHALGEVLHWERVLADLHSGRILPVVGRYIVDLAALCLLYLSVTGITIWVRTRKLI